MWTLIANGIMPIGLALIVYELVSVLIANGIMPIGLTLIVTRLCPVLKLIADGIVPIGLALIVHMIVSGFDIDNKVKSSYTWIDTGLRNPYGVRHLIHLYSL